MLTPQVKNLIEKGATFNFLSEPSNIRSVYKKLNCFVFVYIWQINADFYDFFLLFLSESTAENAVRNIIVPILLHFVSFLFNGYLNFDHFQTIAAEWWYIFVYLQGIFFSQSHLSFSQKNKPVKRASG